MWSQKHLGTPTLKPSGARELDTFLAAFLRVSDIAVRPGRFSAYFQTLSRGIGFLRVHRRIRSSVTGRAGLTLSPLGNSFLPLGASHLKKEQLEEKSPRFLYRGGLK